MVEMGGIDLPCGAGRLGLQGAPGALPSALGFDSRSYGKKKYPARWAGYFFLAEKERFELSRRFPDLRP